MPGGFTGSRQGRNGALDLGSALLPSLIIGAELHNPAHPSSASSASHKISSELGREEGLKDNIQNKRMKVFLLFYIGDFLLHPRSAAGAGARWLRDNERGEVETNGPVLTPTRRTG